MFSAQRRPHLGRRVEEGERRAQHGRQQLRVERARRAHTPHVEEVARHTRRHHCNQQRHRSPNIKL